jgi:hypothetical protein
MSLFVATLREESEDHTVELDDIGFTIHRKPGREGEFDALARQVLAKVDTFAALPRKDEQGRYDCVQIILAEHLRRRPG